MRPIQLITAVNSDNGPETRKVALFDISRAMLANGTPGCVVSALMDGLEIDASALTVLTNDRMNEVNNYHLDIQNNLREQIARQETEIQQKRKMTTAAAEAFTILENLIDEVQKLERVKGEPRSKVQARRALLFKMRKFCVESQMALPIESVAMAMGQMKPEESAPKHACRSGHLHSDKVSQERCDRCSKRRIAAAKRSLGC